MLVKTGAILAVGGLIVLGIYFLVVGGRAFLASREAPLLLKIVLPFVGAGVLLLLAAVARDRYRAARKEPFQEVER
ncbi:MAG: hypothetical protein HYX99_02025 [Chloroflexi bacterium]|nr:hypothetical protein [Chloroflexota bacterium]